MRKGRALLLAGLLLIAIAAPSIFAISQELILQKKVDMRYEIKNIYHPFDLTSDPFDSMQYLHDGVMHPFPEMKREVYVNNAQIFSYDEFMNEINISTENQLARILSFYDTEIAITDTFTGTFAPDATELSETKIIIDGTNYAELIPLEIRANYLDNNRYHGYIGMVKMTDKLTEEEELVIIQRLFDDSFISQEQDFRWKKISIAKNGAIQTDIFTRERMAVEAYLTDFINKATVAPYALGYKSNVLHYYPSLIYPFFYPFAMLGLGLIFVLMGLFRRRIKIKQWGWDITSSK